MEAMRQLPDKAFDLAVVDPPYGDVTPGGYFTGKSAGGVAKHPPYNPAVWYQKKPDQEYFKELFRVSKNQIVWGGNFFSAEIRRDSPCWIVWDKCNGVTNWADCELAWTSFGTAVRMFRFLWCGMLQGRNMTDGEKAQGNKSLNEIRIHPTQKPVPLYEWLLTHYAKPGNRILDTHLGSGSSRIAAYNLGFDFTGYEIDEGYFRDQENRFEAHTAQISLFNTND
jgi:site-specific DNA-methyltransferase (adenine-specific)